MDTTFDSDTLLAVDVGSTNTRASLFDIVEGRYRLVASGRARSTVGPPLFDVREGVRMAIDRIQTITGRQLVDETDMLVMPVTPDGEGVDVFVATTSAGPRVRTVLVGLMPGISMQSGRRLAASTYLDVVAEIDLLDRREAEEKLDSILAANPDLIVVVGGTDGGASASVIEMVDLVGLATRLLPEGHRPQVVFAGNRTLGAPVAERFDQHLPVTLTPNVRPALEEEDLSPARARLGEVIAEARASRIAGFDELFQWSGGYFMPTADGFGRVIRYLSQVYDPLKGVLGVDLGSSHTTIAASFGGNLRVNVNSDLGMGSSLPGLLEHIQIPEVVRWLPVDVPPAEALDYVYNKALHPESVPSEINDLHLELALARELVRAALKEARKGWPRGYDLESRPLLPPLEPILASGGVLSRAPHPGYAAMALLDALEPVGITTLVLDPHNIASALGAAAGPLPMAAVQVLSSGNFVSLATVVAPLGRARPGRPVVHVRLERHRHGDSLEGEARYGQLVVLPLGQGETGRLILRPEKGFDVGFGGPGKAGALRVAGGVLGLILDARGRPLELSPDSETRVEVNNKWLWDLGVR